MATHWYYRVMGQEFGPFTSEELRQKAAAGDIAQDDWVRREDRTEWVDAARIKGLFDQPPAESESVETSESADAAPDPDRRKKNVILVVMVCLLVAWLAAIGPAIVFYFYRGWQADRQVRQFLDDVAGGDSYKVTSRQRDQNGNLNVQMIVNKTDGVVWYNVTLYFRGQQFVQGEYTVD